MEDTSEHDKFKAARDEERQQEYHDKRAEEQRQALNEDAAVADSADFWRQTDNEVRNYLRNSMLNPYQPLKPVNPLPDYTKLPGDSGGIPDYLKDKRNFLQKGYSCVRDWIQQNPALAMDMGLTTAGITAGALLDRKNRLRGAAIGGVSALLTSVLGRQLYKEYNA